MSFKRGAASAALCLLFASAAPSALAQFVPLVGGTPATQTFDTLTAGGTGAAVPDGWYFVETGSNANTTYAADDGATNSGNTYSYGANGSGERAFGTIRSGTLASTLGARLRNDSGAALGAIAVGYSGEQWRLGASGRADALRVQYSLDATSLGDNAAAWVDVPALDFSSPVTTGAAGKLDGNLAANRRAIDATIDGLNLAPGASLWLRWVDVDIAGAEDGLAIDDVRFAVAGDPPVDLPPTVVSTQPADGAHNVAAGSDLHVTFSEAVVTTDAFELACNAEPIALDESGSGATRTLTPHTMLPPAASCTLAILAGGVRNAADIAMAANYTATFSVAAGSPDGYYAQVNTSSPEQLRCSLHQVIRGHTVYPYSGAGTSTWTILELAQASAADPDRILDVYRNRLYNRGSDRAGTGSGLTYNREHTWPNSLGFPGSTGNLGKPNAPYTDTHMLWLSDTQWNADRGNKPFANCSSNCGERATEVNEGHGGGSGVYPGNSNWVRTPDGNGGSFEVWNHRKGDMARAVMYMAIRYEGGVDPVSGQNEPELELTDDRSKIVGMNNYSQTAYMGLLADLLAWHQADPPDDGERARDEVVYTFQGNRNPFIDHPEWATRALFESVAPEVCVLNEDDDDDDAIFRNGFETAP